MGVPPKIGRLTINGGELTGMIFMNYSSLVPGIFMNIHEHKIAP